LADANLKKERKVYFNDWVLTKKIIDPKKNLVNDSGVLGTLPLILRPKLYFRDSW
jgi:hypothetical protein